jgi:hypothetical protein
MLFYGGVYVGGAGSAARFYRVKASTNVELNQLTHTLIRFHGVFAPNSKHRTASTEHGLRRQSGVKAASPKERMARTRKSLFSVLRP